MQFSINIELATANWRWDMLFELLGSKDKPVILFFHAMGVTGDSSKPITNYLKEDYCVVLPTSAVYCPNQKYVSKEDEVKQVESYLTKQGISDITLVVASSIGADLACAFLAHTKRNIAHVFFDGGQFAQISATTRRIMVPFLYLAIKSLYWSKGKTLKKIMWCDDDSIKPFFIKAGQNLTYSNMRRQMKDSLVDKPFVTFSRELQEKTFFEFGSIEDHFKYRDAVRKAYPYANYPVFENYNHMQYQIKNPKGFAEMLVYIIKNNKMPKLDFLRN